ncbi:tetratricopeptide repeat protein [Thermogemmatispora carboxidivorans]|uniref:tetratricopeptide repeat protein n=1 Tax=Thermogemmatispora carboxidivorans TaxID=1382306 RepID=UPI0012DF5A98
MIALAKTQLKQAAELFQQAHMLARDCKGDEEVALLIEHGLGRLAACKKSWPEAISRLRNVCEGAQRLQNRYLQAHSFLEMAGVLQHSGQYAAANHYCLQAQALARQEDYHLLLAHSEILLGDLLMTQGQVAQALAHYREGCSLSALTEAQTHLQARQRLIEGLSSVSQGFGKRSEKFCQQQKQITGSSLLEGQADEGL